jgi:type I restriction enzyme S subunit
VRGLPERWLWTTIGAFCERPQYGWTTSASDTRAEFKLLRTSDFSNRALEWDNVPYVSSVPDNLSLYLVHQGDIFVSRAGARAGVGVFIETPPPKAVFASYLIRIRPLLAETAPFLRYFLQSNEYWSQIADNRVGIAQPNINAVRLSQLRVPLPPIAEQRRIVAEIEKQFTRLDQSTTTLAMVSNKIDLLIRSRLHQLSVSQAEWPLRTVAEVAECLDGKRVPVNKRERARHMGDIPYYGANGQVGWIDRVLFDEPLVLVVEDETFIGRRKPFSYMINGPAWVNNHAHVLRPKDAMIPEYLNFALSYYPFTPLTTGSTGRRKLTQRALMSAPLRVPMKQLQQLITNELEAVVTEAAQQKKVLKVCTARAGRLRQAILAKAFSGQLVPQDPNDEPASVLLERIRANRPDARKSAAHRKRTAAQAELTLQS